LLAVITDITVYYLCNDVKFCFTENLQYLKFIS